MRLDDYPFEPRPGEYLAFVGRISPDKGVATAIRVARKAGWPIRLAARMPLDQPHNPEAQRDWQYYEAEVEPLLREPAVEYLGELDDAAKAALLSGAAGLLFPIDWPEPFGLVMIEALACGTPVVALRRGSTPEIIVDGVNGFLAVDESGLIAAVGRLGEIDRHTCRAGVEQRFSAASMAEGYERTFAALLGMACANSAGEAA
jgi:glycosyltransferase involved in cell wall biosynthesis